MLTLALGNMKNPRAIDVLIELLQNDVVAEQELTALGLLRAQKAKQHVQCFLHHPQPWMRKAAKQALAKIGR